MSGCTDENSTDSKNIESSEKATLSKVDALFARASALAAHDLADPDSAKFRGLFQTKAGWPTAQDRAVCGEINAKNLYGAYSGFTKFIYTETNFPSTTDADQISTDPFKFNSQIKLPKTPVDFHYWPNLIAEVCH